VELARAMPLRVCCRVGCLRLRYCSVGGSPVVGGVWGWAGGVLHFSAGGSSGFWVDGLGGLTRWCVLLLWLEQKSITKRIKDPNAPKRPLSAFLEYVSH
jgi:hypothetical protein